MLLLNVPDQARPDFHAELVQKEMANEDFRSRAERLLKIGKILAEAWENHPLYGQTISPERWSNPMIRLEVHHGPGPRTGTTVSISFVRLSESSGEMADICRKMRNVADWTFQIMPVDPEDPVLGYPPKNPQLYGDWFRRIPRFWDFPNQSGLNFMARKRFKERFPKTRPILAEALLTKKRHTSVRKEFGKRLAAAGIGRLGTRKEEFLLTVARRSEWLDILDQAGLSASDVWDVATNQLKPDDIDRLGRQQRLL